MGKGGGSAAGSYEHRRSEKGLATVGSHLNKTLGILVQFWEWKDSARTSTTLDSDIIMTELCLHVLALQDHRYRSCHIFAQIAIFVVSQCWNFGRCSCRTLRVCTCRGFQRKFLPSFICLEHAGIIESRSVYRAGGHSFCLLFLATASLLLAWRSGTLAWHMLLSIPPVRACRCMTSIQARHHSLSLCFSFSSLGFAAVVFLPTHSITSQR